ncbi:hypothetical protein GIB67_042677 [Kingdonia uniflora]|uniref:Uncharacterized protein n=1 Tax=Kingdonia uniflora TaxID=39325 RepID=A0A7J7P269_9MAGN|nr:hypothetical protein GIB67_042677 [Kingdonia uniflora]
MQTKFTLDILQDISLGVALGSTTQISMFMVSTKLLQFTLTKRLPKIPLISYIDCRARFELALPITYFGNCVLGCFNSATKSDFVGEDGIAMAPEVIRNRIQGMKDDDRLLKRA